MAWTYCGLHREGIGTPVLMVSQFGDERLATGVLRAGAVDYVPKKEDWLTELPKRVLESVTRHRLQQSNHLLIAALESARDGIFITDLQGQVLHVNGALGTHVRLRSRRADRPRRRDPA